MLANIAVVSYVTAAISYSILSLLLLTSWRGCLHGLVLVIACILSVFWALSISYQIFTNIQPISLLTDILEIFRNTGWIVFLVILLGPFRQSNQNSSLQLKPIVKYGISIYLVLSFISVYSHGTIDRSHFEFFDFQVSILISILTATAGIILVEQLYRNTPKKLRWGIKFICLGIGSIFIYDFYLYSNALFSGYVSLEIWTARGIINALAVPLIAISAARNPEWSLRISASRKVVFYSATLFGTVTYLLITTVVSYYLRISGGDWGTVFQVIFSFGALILLISLFLSGTLRSWLRIAISKHFFNYNYDYREEWLKFTETLSENELELEERIIQALAQLVESPGGALWIKKESGNFELITNWNTSYPNISSFNSIHYESLKFLEKQEKIIEIQRNNKTIESNKTLSSWLLSIPNAWLLIPLIQHHSLLGFVLLKKPRSEILLNWEVFDLLKAAGNQAASYLAQKEATKALIVARQFESFYRTATFMVHDLKNLVTQLSLLVSNAKKYEENPEFQKDMIGTVDLSIQRMKRLLTKINNDNLNEKPAALLIDKLLRALVESKSGYKPKPILEIKDYNLSVFANFFRLERTIGNLIQNAIEATAKNGEVRVGLMKKGNLIIIETKDTGHGMSNKFIREKLFCPFQSTKSSGMGIGVYECKEYICELGGQLKVISSKLAGTTFHIKLPIYQDNNALTTIY